MSTSFVFLLRCTQMITATINMAAGESTSKLLGAYQDNHAELAVVSNTYSAPWSYDFVIQQGAFSKQALEQPPQ
jgi:hypothetical protein